MTPPVGEAGEHSVVACDDALDVGVVHDAQTHDVAVLSQLGRAARHGRLGIGKRLHRLGTTRAQMASG